MRKSLIKYCYEGRFGIASGDGKDFAKFYWQENAPFLDVTDGSYWLVDNSLKAVAEPLPPKPGETNPLSSIPQPDELAEPETRAKELKSITI